MNVLRTTDRLEGLRDNGLRAAVSQGLRGLSAPTSRGNWVGIDVDFARALAIAICGDEEAVEWIPSSPGQRISTVVRGEADLGVCNLSWTFERDPEALFVGAWFIDSEGILTGTDRTSINDLSGLPVAVQGGTTSAGNLERLARRGGPRLLAAVHGTHEDCLRAYLEGACAGYVLDKTALAGIRAGLADPHRHQILADDLSREPMAPFVGPVDVELFRIARHVLMFLIRAETGMNRDELDRADQAGQRLGLIRGWARDSLETVGDHGRIFSRNLGTESGLELSRGNNVDVGSGGWLFSPSNV